MLSVFNDDFLKFSSGNNLFYTQQDHYIHFPLVVTVCGSKIWFSWTLFVRPFRMMRQQHYLSLYTILNINSFYFFHLSPQYSFRGCVRKGRCQPQQYVTCKTYLTSASLDTWHLTKNGLTRRQTQMDERNNRGNAQS